MCVIATSGSNRATIEETYICLAICAFFSMTFVVVRCADIINNRRMKIKTHHPELLESAKSSPPSMPAGVHTYLMDILNQEKDKYIGEGSRYHAARKKACEELAAVKKIQERVNLRFCRPNYVGPTYGETLETLRQAEQNIKIFDDYQAKLEAYFAECQSVIGRESEMLTDLAMVEELEQLNHSISETHERAMATITQDIAELGKRLLALQETVERQFGNEGAQICLAAKNGDIQQNIADTERVATLFASIEMPKFKEDEVLILQEQNS